MSGRVRRNSSNRNAVNGNVGSAKNPSNLQAQAAEFIPRGLDAVISKPTATPVVVANGSNNYRPPSGTGKTAAAEQAAAPTPPPAQPTGPIKHLVKIDAWNRALTYDGQPYQPSSSRRVYPACATFLDLAKGRSGYALNCTVYEYQGTPCEIDGQIRTEKSPDPFVFGRTPCPQGHWLIPIERHITTVLSRIINNPHMLNDMVEAVKKGKNAHNYLSQRNI